MDPGVGKVAMLLSIFQASLFDHMITVAKNRENEVFIGKVSDKVLDTLIREESKEESKAESLQEASEALENEEEIIEKVELIIEKHGKLVKSVKSVKSEGFGMGTCRGIRKANGIVEDIEGEYQETGQVKRKVESRIAKVLQRMGEPEVKEAKFIVPEESKVESTQGSVYGEVIATAYSQGGDGFALHPGDFVSVLQILHEFGLVECKWQGLKGLFPVDKIRVLARPSDSMDSSMSSIISKQFLQSRPITFDSLSMVKGSKLMGRLMKKPV